MAFTFTVEDGTGLAAANSFGTVAEADDYHEGRGNTAWAAIASSDLKEDCLVRGADYIEKRFGHKFRGFRRSGDQGMSWPRLDAWDNDGYAFDDVPTKLKQAQFEYALRSNDLHELTPDPLSPVQPQSNLTGETRATGPTGGVKKFKEVVGPIEEETEYDKGGSLSAAGVAPKSSLISDYNIPEYPAADMLLHGMLLNSSSRTVVRG
jgi:hypothetical protein